MDSQDLTNNAFQELSHRLVPSDTWIRDGHLAVNKMFDEIKGKSRFKLSRSYICGSDGKKTAIFNSDFDCVIFVKVETISEIRKVLDDFENVLLLAHLPKLKNLRITKFAIQFQYDGFDMDFLPAIDFVTSVPHDQKLGSQQALKALECIYRDKAKAYYYSSALAESQLAFMKQQSSFVHELVRLCKLWNKSLLIDEYISGRSTLIELVAISAGKKEENRTCFKEKLSLLRAFNTFLKLMKNFSELKIEFGFDPLAAVRKSTNDFPWLKQNQELKQTTPYVIEPANPFNNLAKGVKPSQMKLFELYATETLRRLDAYVTVKQFAPIPLDVIFEPQPMMYAYMTDDMRKFFQSASIVLSSRVNEGPSSPTMKIRNEEKYKKCEMQVVLKHLQTVFSVVAQSFISSKYLCQSTTSQICSELQKKFQTVIEANVLGKAHAWSSSPNKHEDYEVTFSIPSYMMMNGKEEKFCVYISLSSQ